MLVLSPLRCRRHLNGDNGHEGLENDGHFTHFSDYFFCTQLVQTKMETPPASDRFHSSQAKKKWDNALCMLSHTWLCSQIAICLHSQATPPSLRLCLAFLINLLHIYSLLFDCGVSASRPAQIPKDLGTKHEMLCIGGSRGRLPNTFLISPVYLCYKKHSFVYLQFHYRFDPCFL